MMKFALTIMLLCLLAPRTAMAATYYVATTGNDASSGGQTQPFASIGRGIAASVSGDTILVADGTYNEHGLDFGAKNLVLQSQSGNPAACVLDCQELGNGIFIRGGQTFATTVSGLTIENAVPFGTAFSGSFGSSSMYISNGSATLTNCVFRNNNRVAANGVLIGSAGSAILKNCTFTTSIAQASSGTMLDAGGNAVTLINCSFANNVCGTLHLSAGNATVTGCNFTGNKNWGGGGIHIGGSASATITDCSFSGNGASQGGGLYMAGGSASVSNCSFVNNYGQNFGGGIGQNGGSLVVENCAFLGNRVQVKGGAIAVGKFSGISSLTLRNCLIARNSSEFGRGCAIELDAFSGANVKVTNCTITENTSDVQSSLEIMVFNEGGTLTVANSIVWNNVVSQGGLQFAANNNGSTTVTYSDVRGGYAGTGNLNADPLFFSAATGNYRLQAGSSCLNTASAAAPGLPATDLDGAPRILGSAPDMGAYEFWLPAYGSWFVDNVVGSDANAGAPTAPFATVTKAVAVAANVNSIYIKQGNYGSDRPRITKALRLVNWRDAGLARIGAP